MLFVNNNLNEVVWSKTPAVLHIGHVGEPPTESVVVQVLSGAGLLATVKHPLITTPVQVDLQKILETVPKPNRPLLLDYLGAFVGAIQQDYGDLVPVSIRAKLASADDSTYTTINKKVLSGGIPTMVPEESMSRNTMPIYNPVRFLPNKGSRFLTYLPERRVLDAKQQGWITYLHDTSHTVTPQATFYVKHLDGTFSTRTILFPPMPNYAWTKWNIPVGIDNANLDPTKKGVFSATLIIEMPPGTEPAMMGSYEFRYSYAPCYDWMDVYYRNSVGGWDFFRFTGVQQISSEFERKEASAWPPGAPGKNFNYSSQFTLKWKCNTGWVSPQMLAALNDLALSNDVCLNFEGDYLPIKCSAKSLPWRNTESGLLSADFEFTSAEFDALPEQLTRLFAAFPENR